MMDLDPDDVVTIRAATVEAADAMIDLHHAAVRRSAVGFYAVDVLDHWSPPPDETRSEEMRTAVRDGELVLVAEQDTIVIAFGSILPERAELRALYVHPDFGRRRIGGRLLSALEVRCGDLTGDWGVLWMLTDEELQTAVRAAGWAAVDERRDPPLRVELLERRVQGERTEKTEWTGSHGGTGNRRRTE